MCEVVIPEHLSSGLVLQVPPSSSVISSDRDNAAMIRTVTMILVIVTVPGADNIFTGEEGRDILPVLCLCLTDTSTNGVPTQQSGPELEQHVWLISALSSTHQVMPADFHKLCVAPVFLLQK